MLEDFEESAAEELKRADHLIYVTLKYTRTVDVIRNTILRLINAMDFAVQEALTYLKVKNISSVARMRMEQLVEKLPKLKEYGAFYFLLRRIYNTGFGKKEEYRKNVTLLTEEGDVNIEVLKEYFETTKRFVKFLEDYCKGIVTYK
ncbi:hypothetical protein HYX16_01395 [Candidatus Woesearchaeota archaeon]|nr:hypothetical protein [Candidatus Woesearchaeota archaeon]